MKSGSLTGRISLAIIIVTIWSQVACKDDEPTLQEQTSALLTSGEWVNPVVTVDGVAHSDLYQSFTITFTSTSYVSSGGSPLWSSTGTWAFKDQNAKAILLNGSQEVQINEITDKNLELSLQNNNNTFKNGRVNSLKGMNIFRLRKK